jgi:hypothetical protein
MQSNHYDSDHLAHQLLYEEWERLANPTAPDGKPAGKKNKAKPKPIHQRAHELSPVIAVLPGLIRLVNECTDRPVNKFRPVIKRLILEQLFMEVGGDSIVDAHHMMLVKQYVELTVRVLVRMRQHDLGKDEWSDMPVTPQMFG